MGPLRISLKNRNAFPSLLMAAGIVGLATFLLLAEGINRGFSWVFIAITWGAYLIICVRHGFERIEIIVKLETLEVCRYFRNTIVSRKIYHYPQMTNIHRRNKVLYEKQTNFLKSFWWSYRDTEIQYDPVILFFNYNGQEVRIGAGKEEFDADKIIREIKKRKAALQKDLKQAKD